MTHKLTPQSPLKETPQFEEIRGWESERMRSARETRKGPATDGQAPAAERALSTPAWAAAGSKVALLLSGQGVDWRGDCSTLMKRSPAARAMFKHASAHLNATVAELSERGRAGFGGGFSLERGDVDRPAMSAPGALVAQLMRVAALDELGACLDEDRVVALVGHSEGALGAACLSALWGVVGSEARAAAAEPWLELALRMGLRMEEGAQAAATPSLTAVAIEDGAGTPTPMAALGGVLTRELRQLVDERDGVFISAVHGPMEHTLAGEPSALEQLRQAVNARAEVVTKAKKSGKAAGRNVHPEWTYLPVFAPFHTPLMQRAYEGFVEDGALIAPRLGSLRVPVLSPTDGAPLTGDVVRALGAAILIEPMSWVASLDAALDAGAELLVDVGPSDGASRLSAIALRGRGIPILATSSARGESELLDPANAPAPWHRPYLDFAPRNVGGQIENRFTRATGCAPVVLPGMTPTTVEAPIVVAAANAGYVAELAGGGQVTEAMLRARLDEICEGLEPGRGIVFNALYLDPYLWGLHFRERGLVPRLKAEGYPIVGVTISAGIPPLDEAVELLSSFRAAGLTLNALKPGTTSQVHEVLEIAAAIEGDLHLHLEGGRAGGHHSWEDLDDLLLRNYDAIRRQPNVVLAVGGGVSDEAKATAYLTGAWAEAYGQPRMPVDAVLLGTRLMATKEARTSDSVKALLASVPGDESRWPLDGQVAGGVTSGRSQLDASIYYVDNAAARVGRLLDGVAGDAEAVSNKRDEIIAALATTAKPYFGDVDAMTYAQLLRRLVELTAIGRDGRYEDGVWPDVSYRRRFAAVFQRAEERLTNAPIASRLEGDPSASIAKLVRAMPGAERCVVHPEDVQHFINVCRWPGKPVCFVPVIDENVRRWYKADSLWQSHDERVDADRVLVIPGPAGVSAIARADEPVAEVLDGFVAHALQALNEAAPALVESPLELALRAQNVFLPDGRAAVNPLASVVRGRRLDRSEGLVAVVEPDGTVCATLTAVGASVRVALLIRAGGDFAQPLDLHLSIAAGVVFWDRDAFLRDQREALRGFMPSGEQRALTVEALRAFQSATDDDTLGIPLSLAFVLAWPEIFEAMCSARGDLFRLVHETNTTTAGSAWPPVLDEALRVEARRSASIDLDGGRQVKTTARIECARGLLATVESSFFIRETLGLVPGAQSFDRDLEETLRVETEGELAFLAELPWLEDFEPSALAMPATLVLNATLSPDGARGVLEDDGGATIATVALRDHSGAQHPVDVLIELLGAPPSRVEIEPQSVGRKNSRAPSNLSAYAFASGDRNPLHLDPVVGRLAGFDAPIVHGMWTAALALHRAVRLAADNDAARVRRVEARFLAPLAPGAELTVEVERVAMARAQQILKVSAAAEDAPVVELEVEIAARPTAYVYPGQGTHAPGMGMDAYESSAAARAVWDQADETTRERFGFSLLEVVRDNPRELWVRGERFNHPKGVLFLTQFTQVALAVLAVAQTRELDEAGLLAEGAAYAGHSLGEYSALAALGGVMPLEGVVEIVYQRGLTMDRLIARDDEGRSPYAMGVIRPHIIGADEARAFAMVEAASSSSGQPLEVVNHNVRGRQYTVTGHVDAIALLRDQLGEAWVDVPGIDVPFHSTLLRDGVDAFRARLEETLPAHIDAASLENRYLPNLTGTFFRLERAFFEEVGAACGSDRVAAWLTHPRPNELGREVLIEVLAWQFASPVRWIQTQDGLFGERPSVAGAQGQGPLTLVEVGAAHAPTLVGMARSTLRGQSARGIVIAHAVNDKQTLRGPSAVEVDAARAQPVQTPKAQEAASAPVLAEAPTPSPTPTSPTGAPLLDDAKVVQSGLKTLLALLAKKDPASLDDGTTLDKVVGGNSARRNQILADLGAEFDAAGMDGAHEVPLGELAQKLSTDRYQGEGAFLAPQLQKTLAATFAPHGLDRAALDKHLEGQWGIPSTHRICVLHDATIAARGLAGSAPSANDKASALGWLDEVAKRYAARVGIALAPPAAAGASLSVDGAALEEAEQRLSAAMQKGGAALAEAFGVSLDRGQAINGASAPGPHPVLLSEVEHGDDYVRAIAPRFSSQLHVSFSSAWAWARRDLLDMKAALDLGEAVGDDARRSLALRLDDQGRRSAEALGVELPEVQDERAFVGRTALVTGAGPGSIALEIIAGLLAGGARVIATTSSYGPARLKLMKDVYQRSATEGAELHVVPFNQGSFDDVDALAGWLGSSIRERVGSTDKVTKAPMVPDLLYPFAAYPETADLTGVGPRSLASLRVNLLGVERLIARLCGLAEAQQGHVHVVLPLSPNHGGFGGDGAYGESKAALEVLMNKWRSEQASWGKQATLVGAKIGWVRGTGLMKQNDDVAEALGRAGLRTFSAAEMAGLILDGTPRAPAPPSILDVTGGLDDLDDVGKILRDERTRAFTLAARDKRKNTLKALYDERLGIVAKPKALLSPRRKSENLAPLPRPGELEGLKSLEHLDLDEVVVVSGFGELGPYGSARTRWDVEKGGTLSVEAVAELAWTMGLIAPADDGDGFVDASDKAKVADADLVERYEARVLEHTGVRVTEPGVVGFDPDALVQLMEVHLDRDFSFPVPSLAVAESLRAHAPEHTEVREQDGTITVTRKQGAVLRVPSALRMSRHVTGQVPTGWDAERLGIPKELVDQVDPVTLYCLVSTAEAFLSAGLEPEEIYKTIHPGRVGITLGTGIGGMKKLMQLHRDHYDGEERQNDTLQETLINVIGGYVVQSYLGSYGPMSFPVGACATAGLSVADGVDKILQGAADIIVAGGADDLSEAGLVGFGDMGATADTRDLEARGIEPSRMSRSSDTRRRGFVEAQGAGVLLLVRASVAAKMGLPVYGVVAYAGTSGDGLQQSVPAPGQGALVAVAGEADAADFDKRRDALRALDDKRSSLIELLGEAEADAVLTRSRRDIAHHGRKGMSPLASALSVLGLVGDDVAVISKHDSSTQANDENEARLHTRIADALGRTPDLPLPVISQKALTGHPKGAAAAWQMNGLMQAMAEGVLPGNPSLDDVSSELRVFGRLVATDRARRVPRASLKAGLVTTLGFGHVSALVCLAHPFLFWKMLGDDARAAYQTRLAARLTTADVRLREVLSAKRPLVTLRSERPFDDAEQEASFLMNPGARFPSSAHGGALFPSSAPGGAL